MLPIQPLLTSEEGIKFYKNIMIPMRDGKKLAMDLYVPTVDAPHPVILTYIPYRKDDLAPFTGMQYCWAKHGFIQGLKGSILVFNFRENQQLVHERTWAGQLSLK